MQNTIQSDLIRGHIDTIILKALYDGDRYGFDIIKEIEQKSGGQYIIKQPTLYSCLKRLEMQGFIRSYWGTKSIGGRRKYFTLTDQGKELFLHNQNEWVYSRSVIDKLIADNDSESSSKAIFDSSNNHDFALPIDNCYPEQELTTYNDYDHDNENLQQYNEEESSISDNVLSMSDIDSYNEVVEHQEINVIEEVQDSSDGDASPCIYPINTSSIQQYDNFSDETNVSYAPPVEEDVFSFHNIPTCENTYPENDSPIICANSCNETAATQLFDTSLTDTTTVEDVKTTEDFLNTFYEQTQDSYTNKLSNDNYVPQSNESRSFSGINYFNDIDYSGCIDEDESQQDKDTLTQSMSEILPAQDEAPSDDIDGRMALERSLVKDPPITTSTKKSTISSTFYGYNEKVEIHESDDDIIDQGYRELLNGLIERNVIKSTEINPSSPPQSPTSDSITFKTRNFGSRANVQASTEKAVVYEEQPSPIDESISANNIVLRNTRLNKIVDDSAQILGDKVVVKSHSSDVYKQYNNKHYFYSNQLKLAQFGIIFLVMLLEICSCFIAIELYFKKNIAIAELDMWMYIGAVILSTLFPVAAYSSARRDFYKRKKINYTPITSMLLSLCIMFMLWVITFEFNVFNGLLSNSFTGYMSTIILPCVLATNVPLSTLIFNGLYSNKKYAVE